MKRSQKGRKYYRKCGVCGDRHEQSEMIRTNDSENGWMCDICYSDTHMHELIMEEIGLEELQECGTHD